MLLKNLENKISNISKQNYSKKEKIFNTINNNDINSFLQNLSDKKKQNIKTNIYNNNMDNKIIKLYKKNIKYLNNNHIKNSPKLNKSSNLLSLNKKKKKHMIRNHPFLNENNNINNIKGLSFNNEFEEIKKYKFRPLTKEKKINLRKRNTTYAKESKKYVKLINSATDITEDEEISEVGKKMQYQNRNMLNNIIKNDIENEKINNKSFI